MTDADPTHRECQRVSFPVKSKNEAHYEASSHQWTLLGTFLGHHTGFLVSRLRTNVGARKWRDWRTHNIYVDCGIHSAGNFVEESLGSFQASFPERFLEPFLELFLEPFLEESRPIEIKCWHANEKSARAR
jgi:hypothetical protein